MALARTMLSTDIAHQINDLIENDPNGTVLLGGGSNLQSYYTFYMQVLVRKLPIGNVQLFLDWYSFCTLGGASKLFVYVLLSGQLLIDKRSSLRS